MELLPTDCSAATGFAVPLVICALSGHAFALGQRKSGS